MPAQRWTTGTLSGIATKFDAAGLFPSHLQTKAFQPVLKALTKYLGIVPVLKAGQKIVGKTKIVRFTFGMPFYPMPEPQVQCVMQIDV